jgi:hypothetical protein
MNLPLIVQLKIKSFYSFLFKLSPYHMDLVLESDVTVLCGVFQSSFSRLNLHLRQLFLHFYKEWIKVAVARAFMIRVILIASVIIHSL